MILFLLTFIMSFTAWSYQIDRVEVNCRPEKICQDRKKQFDTLKGEYRSYLHFKESLKVLSSDGGYREFVYTVADKKLNIDFELKKIIKRVDILYPGSQLDVDPYDVVKFKENDFFDPTFLTLTQEAFKLKLDQLGYPEHSVEMDVKEIGDYVEVGIVIKLDKPRALTSLKVNTKSLFVKDFIDRKFKTLYGTPFDFNKYRLTLDDAQKELFSYGYYLINLDMETSVDGKKVDLVVNSENEQLYTFDFSGTTLEKKDELLTLITGLFRQYKRPITESIIRQELQEHFKKLAFLNVKIKINRENFDNKFKENVQLYRINIIEGKRTRLVDVSFTGPNYYSEEKLKRYFKNEAFELASLNYFDQEYFDYFSEYLKKRYISRGYVQIKILGPYVTYNEDKSEASLEYVIQESRVSTVRNILFNGIPLEFEHTILERLKNKVDKSFNPIDLTDDIKTVNQFLQSKGYYFAEVTNINENSFVSYSANGSDVEINFDVNLGPLVRLNRTIFIGNLKTQRRILEKKISLKRGDIITPGKTSALEAILSSTGLFNSVSINPIRHSSSNEHTDLLVRVAERDYGLVEIAPGYRTDLGVKLSATAGYQNISGTNQSLTLRSQVNQRLDYQTLDQNRRKMDKRLLEHNTSLTYNKNDLFDTNVDLQTGLAYQRRRFYSFDADIARFNTTITRDLTKRVSASLRYQLEAISQFNATESMDNGSFKIGALTPSLTYDLRNSQINPTAGAFFNMSVEYANPFFLSQETQNLTIDYYKLISRNRFYIPFKNGTIAISMVGGIQENLNREKVPGGTWEGESLRQGYIPNIKVFRLSGMDIVRGFQDEEINRVHDGRDISEYRVQNRAYLANLKVEPRYFVNDKVIIGAFYDAGRVFVDRVDFGELRDSVGLTLKILTPVGTLDFDYGIKLLRKRGPNGRLEDPGRFHVSIGFF